MIASSAIEATPATHIANEAYDEWAWLYDQTVGQDYCKLQLETLQRVLLSKIPNNARLLDLCCGTGLLIKPLLERGYQVTGIDNSQSMLECARYNAAKADYQLADARDFSLQQQVHGAFSNSASLNHIESIEDLEKVFKCTFEALQEQGVFVFDLNHPEQLKRWWRNAPLEGEISNDYAWMITPRYDADRATGAFKVTFFRAPAQSISTPSGLLRTFKSKLYQMLSRPRFIGLRLKLIQKLDHIEPSWQRRDIDYPIVGHDIEAVKQALAAAGFENIQVQTHNGDHPIDANHSAYFICHKGIV